MSLISIDSSTISITHELPDRPDLTPGSKDYVAALQDLRRDVRIEFAFTTQELNERLAEREAVAQQIRIQQALQS